MSASCVVAAVLLNRGESVNALTPREESSRVNASSSSKRAMDLLLAVPAMLITAPLVGVLALLVKFSSRGPAFYAQERAFRSELGYPPFARLARLVYSDPSPARCRQEAQGLARELHEIIQRCGLNQVSIVGPTPCFFSRLRGKRRWQIIVRAPHLAPVSGEAEESDLHALFEHLDLPAGWRLDIDPLDML